MKCPFPLCLRTRRRSNPRNPKASPFSVSTTLVFSWFNSTDKCKLFLEPLQSPFGPVPFRMVAADGDDDVIGEPVIVHCLVIPFRRFATNCVEVPVHLVQIDIRSQRAERSPLRDTDGSADFDDLLCQVQDLRVLDSLRDLV